MSFIDHWHDAVAEGVSGDERAALPELAASLKRVIRGTRPLMSLAVSPLLCAMICALHRDRNRQLPSDRIQLYEACCEMLLERRELERRVDHRDYPALTYRQKRALIEGLAYRLIRNGWTSVELSDVDEYIHSRLPSLPGLLSSVTGYDVRRLFVERTGMLREPIRGRAEFTHRTFQEFLAAHAVVAERDHGVLIDHADDDQWSEVVILAAGLLDRYRRAEFIETLLERGDTDATRRARLHLLAVSCLETAVELDPGLTRAVAGRLSALVPPKNASEARAMAAAGEMALPYLAAGRLWSAREAAACVRALGLIGGDAALSVLEGYTSDVRQTVTDALISVGGTFDPEIYTRKIIMKRFQSAKEVTINRRFPNSATTCVSHIPFVIIHNVSGSDLSELFHFTDLIPNTRSPAV